MEMLMRNNWFFFFENNDSLLNDHKEKPQRKIKTINKLTEKSKQKNNKEKLVHLGWSTIQNWFIQILGPTIREKKKTIKIWNMKTENN